MGQQFLDLNGVKKIVESLQDKISELQYEVKALKNRVEALEKKSN